MEKEKFLECRNEIVKALETHGVDRKNAAIIFASAINEYYADGCYVASILLTPVVQEVGGEQAGINVKVENRQVETSSETFMSALKAMIDRELKAIKNPA